MTKPPKARRADSASNDNVRVPEQHESLRLLVRDLIEQHGKPSAKDIKWAERALAQRRA